jgi:hypothetical protein
LLLLATIQISTTLQLVTVIWVSDFEKETVTLTVQTPMNTHVEYYTKAHIHVQEMLTFKLTSFEVYGKASILKYRKLSEDSIFIFSSLISAVSVLAFTGRRPTQVDKIEAVVCRKISSAMDVNSEGKMN